MFGHPKEKIFTEKTRINFEVYGQNYPITPEAREKRLLFLLTYPHHNNLESCNLASIKENSF